MPVREKVYRLTFDEGHELHGFTVRIKTLSIAEMFDFIEIMHGGCPDRFADEFAPLPDDAAPGATPRLVKPAFQAAFDWTIDLIGERVVSWDFELPSTGPVPATVEGARTLDREALLLLREAWADALRTVNRPLQKPSSSGQPSVPALPTPMVPLSTSQAS